MAFPERITFKASVPVGELGSILHDELKWPSAFSLVLKGKPVQDRMGMVHQRYQQLYKDTPVFGATLAVHAENGEMHSMNGELVEANGPAGAQGTVLGSEAALEAAMRIIGAKAYMWESSKMEAFIKREQHDPHASFKPVPKLVYYPMAFPKLNGELRLAYIVDVYALQPRSRHYVIVDAITGERLNSIERLHAIDEPGTAQTSYSGVQPIVTFRPSASGAYQLKDLSRGGGIITYDCGNTDNYDAATVPSNPSNNWNLGSIYANSILDAHWGTEKTYDYYLSENNWNSYDNDGSPLLSYAHFNLIDYGYSNNNNAFWDGERMTYGDGDGTTYNPLTAIDVLGHEITHGVTEHSAGLVYQDEPGALNESFSDIIGSCIEHYAKPAGFSWLLGNDMSVNGVAIRNMANPNSEGDPDTYQGTNWYFGTLDNGGVHTNSGVQNFWFYLLCEGGTGTNDNGDTYSVAGIGIENAGDIVFHSLTTYLNANSEYADARAGSIQAATDLFGACSAELAAVTNAWYAVGVGDPFNSAVVAAFTPSVFYNCAAPATVQFTNGSLNSSSYVWDFGDGATSTEVSPVHTYNAPGSYTVTLVANGSTLCNSTDTLVSSIPIVVDNADALAPAACTPAAVNPGANAGIFNFAFASTIDQPSTGAVDGYQDFSCQSLADVTEGLAYPMSVALHVPGHVGFWIDLNNDAAFTANERVYASQQESLIHTTTVIIPAGTVFNTRLRARVVSSSQPVTTACTVGDGQAEDYSVRIQDNDAAPIADFTASPITVLVGGSASFQDLSLNAPVQWAWTFEGGGITTSTAQNPQVTYAATGDYDVQLVVTNVHGVDTLNIPDYIHVISAFNLCQVSLATAASGTFYDTGGASGNYSSNETCTLLVAPPCAANITVSFQAFSTESGWDFLNFYDGADENAPLLGSFTGTTLPAGFTTTGGQLFVKWTSDQSMTSSGFAVNWTAQAGSSAPLTAVASVDNNAPAFGQAVQFTDQSTESPSTWNWDFGDGTSSTLQNPQHVYNTAGTMTVVLTAANCSGPDTDTLYLNVQQPGAITVVPIPVELNGNPCTDTASTSFTVHNPGGGPLNWAVMSVLSDDFEGTGYNTAMWASSTGANSADCGAQQGAKAHRFSSSGQRTIRTVPLHIQAGSRFSCYLRYGSGGNCETPEVGEYVVLEYSLDGSAWSIISSYPDLSLYSNWTLVDVPMPPAAFGNQTSLRLRQLANSGNTYDVWAIDQASVVAGYSGGLVFSPEAGSTSTGDSTVVSVSVGVSAYAPGTHQEVVQMATNDPAQPILEIPVNITIANLPCAAFAISAPDSCQGQFQFNNTTTNDAGVWHWDFGDGTTSEEQSPAHTFTAMGNYTVTLTAGTAPLSTQFSVVVHADPILVQFTHSDPEANGGTADFVANSANAVQWQWSFGDGGSSDQAAASHTYTAPGMYVVSLTVWTLSGCSASATDTIHYLDAGIAGPALQYLEVLPNPGNGHYIIRNGTTLAMAWLMDASGRPVHTPWSLHPGNNALDISDLASGVYLLIVRTGDGLRQVRIVKQ
ncbi:MAG: M4 family metallopeptidase [Bacteroidetes bacterium]|nr:M4 family metallopeptidase [Bacteroidota bacterium]